MRRAMLCGSGGSGRGLPQSKQASGAFTLLEVMIAMAVFFIVVFAVLNVVVQSLGAARSLQVANARPDCGMVASELSLTNQLEEGFETGDFGDIYPSFHWERQITEVGSNGLFQVDIAIFDRNAKGHQVADGISVLMHKPGSPKKMR